MSATRLLNGTADEIIQKIRIIQKKYEKSNRIITILVMYHDDPRMCGVSDSYNDIDKAIQYIRECDSKGFKVQVRVYYGRMNE